MSSIDSFGVLNDGVTPNMRLGYNSDGAAVYKPMMPPNSPHSAPAPPEPAYQSGGGEGSLTAPGQQNKRKRGRPRKYPLEGGTVAPASTSRALPPPPQVEPGFQTSGFSFPTAAAAVASSGKKPRGRPPGSGRKQQVVAAGSQQVGLMPHVIQVKAGEDVSSKIMSLSQNGTGGICILSANGAISNVTLRQAATSGGTVTYEGRFEILSLSGSYTVSESDGQRSRTGGLSVLLSGPDGRVLGGGVAGLLTAAAPVQVVVGCFISGVGDLNSPNQAAGPSTAPAPGSPASRGTMSESSGGPESPLNQSTGAYNHSNQQGMNALSWQ